MPGAILVATLSVLLTLVGPSLSAAAEAGSAKCVVKGSALFANGRLQALPTSHLAYEFHGKVECETLPAREVRTGTVEVKGEETLSCAGALSNAEQKGTLTLGGVAIPFGLTFFGGGPGSTGLVVKFGDGGVAVGSATFLGSSIEPATECFLLPGAAELEFSATTVGEF